MNRMILENEGNDLSPNFLEVIDFYKFFREQIFMSQITGQPLIVERYIAWLYAILTCRNLNTELVTLFRDYHPQFAFFLECNPEKAFDIVFAKRAISYWETDFATGLTIEKLKKDIVAYRR
ncbi:unnamed protein product, partial [marine sediment metagenome]